MICTDWMGPRNTLPQDFLTLELMTFSKRSSVDLVSTVPSTKSCLGNAMEGHQTISAEKLPWGQPVNPPTVAWDLTMRRFLRTISGRVAQGLQLVIAEQDLMEQEANLQPVEVTALLMEELEARHMFE